MDKKAALRQLITEKVFIRNQDEQIEYKTDPDSWIFDFRKILMNGYASDLIADIFIETYKDRYPFQLGALEIAGVPLVTTLMNKMYQRGYKESNAFFIRKSRKKTGLLRMIEGEVLEDTDIILVDDIINSGGSFWRQIEILEALGHRVDTVWSLLRFRDPDFYRNFHNRGIKVESVFELNDLTEMLDGRVANLPKREPPTPMPFEVDWFFKGGQPKLGAVFPKSQPILDEKHLYVGTDDQKMVALDQETGDMVWSFTANTYVTNKGIYSSPALYRNSVIFGSYDGNMYSLDKRTGKVRWIAMDADWVGSSPAVAEELGMVFVGLEFGVFKNKGGIAALNADTGKLIWSDREHHGMTHSSPLYISEQQAVVIGSNDGKVRYYDALTGALKWTFTTFGGAHESSVFSSGFGEGDVKESFAYSRKHDYLIFGAIDGFLYILNRNTGHLVHHVKCVHGLYCTPYIYEDRVYFTSTDKHVRCLDLNTLEMVFEKNLDRTRVFSSPTIIDDRLYVGTNGGRLHELDPRTGESYGYFQAVERITNAVIKNEQTGRYFLPTYANEIIALQRRAGRDATADTPE